MSPEKLAYMANQIGKFYAHQPPNEAVTAVEGHLRRFWDPRMRRTIISHLGDEQVKLDPIVRIAIKHLAEAQPTA